jgi:hypothetical protein
MERSSIQCKPKSLLAISQALPKSGVSSSLMTESLNGQLAAKACGVLPSCVIAPAAVSDAMKLRRDGDMGADPFVTANTITNGNHRVQACATAGQPPPPSVPAQQQTVSVWRHTANPALWPINDFLTISLYRST